jgi:hypothetical protein
MGLRNVDCADGMYVAKECVRWRINAFTVSDIQILLHLSVTYLSS